VVQASQCGYRAEDAEDAEADLEGELGGGGRVRHGWVGHGWVGHGWVGHGWVRHGWVRHGWVGRVA
jgi:hypothetical protein